MALRRRLSPGLPLSHTSEEACDPAVLFCEALTIIWRGFFSVHMGDDYSNELSRAQELLLATRRLALLMLATVFCQERASGARFMWRLWVRFDLRRNGSHRPALNQDVLMTADVRTSSKS